MAAKTTGKSKATNNAGQAAAVLSAEEIGRRHEDRRQALLRLAELADTLEGGAEWRDAKPLAAKILRYPDGGPEGRLVLQEWYTEANADDPKSTLTLELKTACKMWGLCGPNAPVSPLDTIPKKLRATVEHLSVALENTSIPSTADVPNLCDSIHDEAGRFCFEYRSRLRECTRTENDLERLELWGEMQGVAVEPLAVLRRALRAARFVIENPSRLHAAGDILDSALLDKIDKNPIAGEIIAVTQARDALEAITPTTDALKRKAQAITHKTRPAAPGETPQQTASGAGGGSVKSNPPTPGYLGLIVDRENCEIRRQGHDSIIDLRDSPRLWETFIAFFDGGENGCTPEAWSNALSGEREAANLRDHKRRLKDQLTALAITIPDRERRLLDDGQ